MPSHAPPPALREVAVLLLQREIPLAGVKVGWPEEECWTLALQILWVLEGEIR